MLDRKMLLAAGLSAGLFALSGAALAQDQQPDEAGKMAGDCPHHGMMQQGHGMKGHGMQGHGMQGHGMQGHGMMGHGMMGPGMMGPGMMGQGYMGPGQGMGPGMMMGQGYGMGPGMMMVPGYGMGPGTMMGQGPGMMGPGMMGPGMMGPGMMGGGMMGPGMMGEQAGRDLSVEDVRQILEGRLAWMRNPNLKLGGVEAADDDTVVAEIVTQDGSLVQRLEVDRGSGAMRPAQ